MKQKTLLAFIAVICMTFVACGQPSETSASSLDDSSSKIESSEPGSTPSIAENVLAHWKFQNVEGYYSGNIDTDELRFIDLTGNGNDMVVEYEGFGNELDIFTWDAGTAGEDTTSLKFNNTLALAESVDPYDKSQTTYSGAYVSGKYLETVEDAPINSFEGKNGWTIEIIFKVSTDWNNEYNRYTGIFSRQGVLSSNDEPCFSMALSSANEAVTGAIGETNTIGLQLVHTNQFTGVTKKEFSSVAAESWIHYMVVGDDNKISVYVNGEKIEEWGNNSRLYTLDYGWEVGVGRKLGVGEVTMNTQYPEGLIRRLFCGSISEIRFTSGGITLEESLWEQLK